MLRRVPSIVIAACTLACFTDRTPAEDAITKPRAAEVAGRAAAELGNRILSATQERPVRVAVFPVTGPSGRVTPGALGPALAVQGELINALRRLQVADQLTVIGIEGLRQSLLDAKVDPSRLDPTDPGQLGEALGKIPAHVAIVGRSEAAADRPGGSIAFRAIAWGMGEPRSIAEVEAPAPRPTAALNNRPSGRFNVEILIDGVPIELEPLSPSGQASDLPNTFLARIDPTLVDYVDGKVGKSVPYAIRITNTGRNLVGWRNERDPERLFGAALLVEGVNTLLMADGKVPAAFVGGDSWRVKKWIVTAPGTRMVRNPDRTAGAIPEARRGQHPSDCPGCASCRGYDLAAVKGDGGSVVTIRGFQYGSKVARQFTLAAPHCSVARRKGGGDVNVGVIEVQFFAQKLDRDREDVVAQGGPTIGTALGEPVPQHIFPVKVEGGLYEEPVESWRILYYIGVESEPPVIEDLIPIG